MKHLTFTAILLLLASVLRAQDTLSVVVLQQQKTINEIQLNLRQAQRHHNASLICYVAAFGTAVLGGTSSSDKSKGFYIGTGVLGLAGFLFNHAAWSAVGRAGKYGYVKQPRYRYDWREEYQDTAEDDEDWSPKKGDLTDVIKRQ